MRRISPLCPKCKKMNTYDILPKLPNIPHIQLSGYRLAKLEFSRQDLEAPTEISIGNAKYQCIDCGHTWKKYRGRKPYEKIQAIYVYSGGFPGPYFSIKIDLAAGTVDRREEERLEPISIAEMELSQIPPTKEEMEWFRSELYKCDFINWAEEYDETSLICDGSHWSIRIEYDMYCEMKQGSNHFPPKWTRFCKAVAKISRGEFY